MSENSLSVKIKQRYDTEANWSSINPILLEGEIAISSDKGLFKIGNGTSTWSALSYNNANTANNATSATKLTSSSGSSTQPVYFSDGKPAACGFTLPSPTTSDNDKILSVVNGVYSLITVTNAEGVKY